MHRTLLLLALAFVLGTSGPACAEPEPDLEDTLAAYLAARDAPTRRRHADVLRALAPDVPTLAGHLEASWRWRAGLDAGGTLTWERETPDGVVHTIYAFVPGSYDPSRAWPALLYLHGDVTRAEDGGGEEGIETLADLAERDGFLLLCPSTQDGSHWWTPNGRELIHGALRDLKVRYRVDADRVAAFGRSDGASACFHLLVHAPDAFCCFLALVGNPLVTETYGGPTWTENLSSRPVYAINGGRDRLYPASRIAPQIEALREAGGRVTWFEEPEAGHDLGFLPRRWPEIRAFWTEHPRETAPAHVTWTTSDPRGARRAWVEIVRLSPRTSSRDAVEPPEDDDLPHVTPQPRLGLRFDAAYAGPGLLVEEVEEGTPADAAGFVRDDVLLAVDGRELLPADGPTLLREHLRRHDERDVTFRVLRDGTGIELVARPRRLQAGTRPTAQERGYAARPATITAEIRAGNRIEVVTDGIGALRLHLLPALLDLERELIVVVDGKEAWHGPVPLDLDHFLAEAWRNGPGAPPVVGCLDLEVAGADAAR